MQILSFQEIKKWFPKRKEDSHKGTYGTLLCITGSNNMPGACALSTLAALRCGAGLVKVATTRQTIHALASQIYEAVYMPMQTDAYGYIQWTDNDSTLRSAIAGASAILIGCGIGISDSTCILVRKVLQHVECPVIIDADGLNCIAACIDIMQEQKPNWIFTPHPGEMARLLKTSTIAVQQNRISSAEMFCKAFCGILVLKGSGTIVQCGTMRVKNPTGNPGMSRGGSGDVLAGMIASFAAQGMSPFTAACAGVYLHGMAGDLAAQRYSQHAMLPQDMINCLKDVFLMIEKTDQANGKQ